MRALLLALIMLNAGLYLWQRYDSGYQEVSEAMAMPAVKGNIVLLSERAAAPEVSGGVRDPEPAAVSSIHTDLALPQNAVTPTAPLECWLLGPFTTVSGGDLPVGLEWRREEYERDADYWVYLGPYADVAAASAMSRELKRKGIDSYVIRRGELNKAVSLGVFSDAKRAEKHQQRMQARGYGADIRKISKFAQRLWLVLKAESDSEIYRSGIAYLQALAGEGQTVEKKSCNRIASYKEFD
jgi:hypothetical protein